MPSSDDPRHRVADIGEYRGITPFRDIYQPLKKDSPRLFDTLERIHSGITILSEQIRETHEEMDGISDDVDNITNIIGGLQTPWLTDIDADNHVLFDLQKLGVGTSTPAYAVDVVGDVNVTGGFKVNGIPLSLGSSQSPWLTDIDGDNHILYDVQKIGIGTSTPGQKLSIVSTASIDGIEVSSVNRSSLWLNVTNGVSRNWLVQSAVSSGDDLQFLASPSPGSAATNPIATLKAGGNVGIGTIAPALRLTVVDLDLNYPTLGAARGGIYFTYDTSWGLMIGHVGNGDIWFQAQRSDGILSSYRLLLNPIGGNVGINTTDPITPLDIAVSGGGHLMVNTEAGGGAALQTMTSGGTAWRPMRLAGSVVYVDVGNLGVGTPNPGNRLTVVPSATPADGMTGAQIRLCESSNNTGFGLHMSYCSNGTSPWFGCLQTIAGGGGYPLALNPYGGNVGVGTTTPTHKLEVHGNISIYGALGVSILTWSPGDSNWRIGMHNDPTYVGFSRTICNSHVQYVTIHGADPASGFVVGNTGNALSSFEVSGYGNGYKAFFRGAVGINTVPVSRLHVLGRTFCQGENEPFSLYISYGAGYNGMFWGAISDGSLTASDAGGANKFFVSPYGNVTAAGWTRSLMTAQTISYGYLDAANRGAIFVNNYVSVPEIWGLANGTDGQIVYLVLFIGVWLRHLYGAYPMHLSTGGDILATPGMAFTCIYASATGKWSVMVPQLHV